MWNTHAKSASWLILEKGLRVASGLLVGTAVARYLGPSSYGTLAIALGTAAVFSAGAAMGADHINTAELSKRSLSVSMHFLISALFARLLWSLACLVSFLILILVAHQVDCQIYMIAAATVPLAAFSIIGNKLQADGDFNRYAQLSSVAIAIGAIVRIAGIYQEAPMSYFALAAVLDTCMATAMLSWWVMRKNTMTLAHYMPTWHVSREYFKLCFPTAISAVLVALYFRLELFMVNSLIDNQAAGLWAGVMMFNAPWSMVVASILPIANKHLSKQGVSSVGYEDKMVRLIRLMLLISVIAVLLNIVVAATIVPLLLGPQYFGITNVLWITSAAIVPLFMGSVQEVWIAQQGTTSIVLRKAIIGIPVSIACLWLFTGKYGLHGAAVGMVFSYFTSAVFLNYLYDRRFLKLQLSAIGVKFAR